MEQKQSKKKSKPAEPAEPVVKKKRARRTKKGKAKPFYVNAKEFKQALKDFYESDNMTEELGEYIMKIASGLSYAPNFINYSYKDDMVGDALVKMFAACENKKFDITSEYNPFSYFTTIAFHAFINRIKKEKRHRDMLNDYQEQLYESLIDSTPPQGKPTSYLEDDNDF